MKNEIMSCPYCKGILEIDVSWAIKNERYFCEHCCKSFPIRIGEVPEKKEETVKEKFDKGVEEILKDEEDEPNFYWKDF